jgi:hemerythrin-like domain-containing protein
VIPANQLSAACGAPEATLDRPLEHLLACHRRIEQRLGALERAAESLGTRRREAEEVIVKVLRFLESNGAWHTEDEEQSLFPRLRPKLAAAHHRDYLGALEAQHDRVEWLMQRLRETALEDPRFPERVFAVAQAYREHIAFEETRLVDLARGALSEGELAEIAAEMKRRRGLAEPSV